MPPPLSRPRKESLNWVALVTVKSERQPDALIFSRLTSGGLPETKFPTAVTEESTKVFVWVWAMENVLDWKLNVKTKVPPRTPLSA